MKFLIGFTVTLLLSTLTHANHDTDKLIKSELLEFKLEGLTIGKPIFKIWSRMPIKIMKLSKQQQNDLKILPKKLFVDPNDLNSLVGKSEYNFTYGFEKKLFSFLMFEKRLQDEVLVFTGLSPSGCSVWFNKNNGLRKIPKGLKDYFFDPCRLSYFDVRGRLIKQEPNQLFENLPLAPYKLLKDKLVIGNSFGVTKESLLGVVNSQKNKIGNIFDGKSFWLAIGYDNLDLVSRHLKENKVNLSQTIYNNLTPLAYSISYHHLEMSKLLLNNGASFNETMPTGHKIGCLSSYLPRKDLKELYKMGLDPNRSYCMVSENCYTSSLVYDVLNHYPDAEKVLLALNHGFDIKKEHCGTSFLKAIEENNRNDLLKVVKDSGSHNL